MIYYSIAAACIVLALSAIAFLKKSSIIKLTNKYHRKELQDDWNAKILQSPSIKDDHNPRNIICYEPSTGKYLGSTFATHPDTVKLLVEKSRTAQNSYKNTSFKKRRQILTTLLDWLVKNQYFVCRMSARDTGKTLLDATFGEIIPTLEKLKWTIANGESALSPEHRDSGTISFMTSARVEYHPIGVMGLIVSWNYPFHNVLSPLISSLMAGNGCVVKCSEHVAWSTAIYQEIVHDILRLHNVDTDLVAFVNGFADAGEALVESADKITFIGSPNVGKMVMRKASETLTPVVLELGGKDAAIIFEDCDFANMKKICARGCLQNAGQNCAGLERMIVQDSIYDKTVKEFTELFKSLRVGYAFEKDYVADVGAITMKNQMYIIQDLIDDAVSKGATLQCGGKAYIHPDYPQGQYYTPTILTDIDSSMNIFHQEVFGPVLLIYKFSTANEAIQILNSTEFGLSSSIFTSDYAKAEIIAPFLKAGMCNVNGWGFSYLCQSLPFGGIGESGFDRFGGIEGLRGNCNIRSATTDKFGVITKVPGILDFPIQPKSGVFQSGIIEFLYAEGLNGKLAGLKKMARCFI